MSEQVPPPAPPRLTMVEAERSLAAELDRLAPVLEPLGERFAAAGHSLHLVGGPVRDAMLGRRSATST